MKNLKIIGFVALSLVALLLLAIKSILTFMASFWIFFVVLLCIVILVLVYPSYYFSSKPFIALKTSLTELVNDINEFNNHIAKIKSTPFILSQKVMGEIKDTSIYNVNRHALNEMQHGNHVHNCSSTVCKNSQLKPLKYIQKYFGVELTEETLSKFEALLNNFIAAQQGRLMLENRYQELQDNITSSIPKIISMWWMSDCIRELGIVKINLDTLEFPKFTFQYVSAGGKSSFINEIELNPDNLEKFILELAELIDFKNSAKGQRALMTKQLRELIKTRDNFTCQCCGASTHQEKNLLLEIDHIHPIAKGGKTEETNLQTLCWRCNRTKGSK